MIYNMVGGGSGGGGLNFKVVGGTSAPANPSENTIWVNTNKEITEWMFCSSEPTDAIEGAVWFLTGASSMVSFNALKKNMVEVYPISANQKVNGTMVGVTAKSWQNGKWSDWWDGEFFDNGNQFEAVTGGWTDSGYTWGNRTKDGSFTADTKLSVYSSGYDTCEVAGTAKKVDLTRFSTLYFNVTNTVDSNCRVGVYSAKKVDDGVVFEKNVENAGLISIDVSSLSGEYYLALYVINGGMGTRTLVVDKVWGCL